ncbi:MAG: chemotaxis-specific protein-glutamate methyltransferase CheB [Gammaproteobacteria bacterium]|nr:chemotaxis-specific protein-glutamate methyltransferase CheB [Gammaproteobacteria bacterium]
MLVDDSPIMLHVLQRMLSRSPEIQVVGTAANGREALDLLPDLNPDVICTDLHMPVMDGLEFTRAVMDEYPRPILVVSVSVEPGSPNIFRLLEAGAVDILPKPCDILGSNLDKPASELASKIRILAGVRVFRRRNNGRGTLAATTAPKPAAIPRPQVPPRIVVIGASTGGPQALREILGSLSARFSLPVVCVQHIGSSFLSELVMWLGKICPLPVRKAAHGETPQAGVIYFAPEDAHLELDEGGCFALSLATPFDGHRPSVTVTMRAAARCFGAGTVGVLLTGMGRDGADGMANIAAAGGITIAQDEASSTVYGMPRQAVELGVVQHILPLEQIAPTLKTIAESGVNY